MFVSVNELVGLPGMPGTAQGVRYSIRKLASSEHFRRKRAGSKTIEYSIDCLPPVTQRALRERHVAQLMATAPQEITIQPPVKRERKQNVVQPVEAYRGSPQLVEERLNALTENQRKVAEARIALVCEVLRISQEPGFSCASAIRFIVSRLAQGNLEERLESLVITANARKGKERTLSAITLKRWIAAFNKAQNAAERLLLLAPGKRDEIKPEEISWLPEFLAQYRQANGRPMSEAYEDFVADWQRRHADEPYMLEVMPSYDVVRYAMKKLPEVVKQKGRVTGSEYRQLEGFTRRDWTAMPVNYVWIGDGHGMKLKCAHPVHGRPFSPEVTFVIDGGTRFVVGWSLDLAENVFAVAGAIQHGIRNHGKPFLYYSDNGSGETADMLDKEIVGILPRLGINHPTGIAGNPQGRGIIERLNRTLPMRIARRYRTYFGKGADRESLRVLNRDLRSAFNALQQDKPLSARQKAAMRELPSWSELIEAIREGVEWYNNRPHSELPMKPNGKHYSPAEFRKKRLAEEDTEIEWLSDIELRDMFRPMVERPVRRCEIQWLNNIYYAPELRDEHGRKVLISYDIHDAERITVRRKDGSFICEAIWNGNKRAAFPVTAEYHKQQQRIKGMRKRAEEKIRDAEDEGIQVIEQKTTEPWLDNVYRPVGNVVTVQPLRCEEVHDDEYETERDEYLNHSLDILEQNRRKKAI
ncbi:DDE-type integrase/transposase/recombinase [Escherichia coli]|uniref:DDE-type integrase/transposase/recombinase n=1 Tax=Salmonella enterica subsp. houtenae serovar 44:z36[z38]:- TaxID=1967609 RepID=A0A736I953_SALHO|nr:transposase [Salmonella enterica subsp. enterica serovar Infantis]EDN7005671.1 DDE-type integrase/transposase/recombinase [Salmonella enterica]EEU0661973.1 DDE-type integrase/transposase/recombinase [Escherichia coli]EHE4029208.1 DDE-type integrase/transposase/recombinase [Salmonella enterica subsp. enterica serovar Adelaide]EKE1866598.1 transposase [Salmonella enterica subsp. enterica serovar Abaetetuba]HAE7581843.1 DDE-type integrase/transposase/recombinase [Salmonella enterica subsp. hou